MSAILTPIIVSFATGLAAIILRYIEKKLMLDKVAEVKTSLDQAKAAPTLDSTNHNIDIALAKTTQILNGRAK